MQTKQYLKQAYRLNELIQSNKLEIADLNQLKVSLPGTDFSQERVQSSSSSDARFTKIVERIIDLEKVINEDTARMLSLKLEIRKVIQAVQDNEERLLLKYRYLNFMRWDEICDEMNVSLRTAHRIHNNALSHVKILKDGTP